MPGRSGLGLCVAATLGVAMLGSIAAARSAAAQGASGFDGDYTGTLTLVEVKSGNCTPSPPGAVYPLTVSGGQVTFAYDPRFDTVLTGSVAPDGTFRASASTSLGAIEMAGQIKGNQVNAQIVSPSCLYNFGPAY
jgi:hypothetical protein